MARIYISKDDVQLLISTDALAEHLQRGWAIATLPDGDVETVASSGSALLVDALVSPVWSIVLDDDCEIDAQATYAETAEITLVFTQDATGGRVVTWADTITWAEGSAPVIATAAGAITVIRLNTYDSAVTWDGAAVDESLLTNILISKYYNHDQKWVRKTGDNSVIQSPNEIMLRIGDNSYFLSAQIELDVDVGADWDTVVGTDYSVAANRAGKDFYVYAVQPVSGSVPGFKLSANSTVPDGYTADNSRKVCGFHCLCVAAGTISGHTLTGYLQGDILPASVWDLYHRPIASPEGMVYSEQAGLWVDIYLASGTGGSTASVNGGTISDTRNWMDFVDDFTAVKKTLLDDSEFQVIAAGSNEETNIAGSADPVTTGGHSDTAARRMISNIGCEDCCGALWQWLRDQSYRFDGAANHTHDVTVSGDPETATTGNPSGDVAPVWEYENLAGAKGSLYKQGTYGDVKLRAGGAWANAATSGSRSRYAYHYRWTASAYNGGRGRSEPRANRF